MFSVMSSSFKMLQYSFWELFTLEYDWVFKQKIDIIMASCQLHRKQVLLNIWVVIYDSVIDYKKTHSVIEPGSTFE